MATSRICSIPECGNKFLARDYCRRHYERWRRSGDPLAGRTPDGEPYRFLCEVVLPYEGNECLFWPYSRDHNGYGQFRHDGRLQYAHRRSCAEKNGPPPSPAHEAAHSCGKGHLACCTKRHLRWATHQENIADKTYNRGGT